MVGSTRGWAETWEILSLFPRHRNPSRADAAEVRPGLPDQVTPTALNERRGSHQELCLKVLSGKNEVYRKVKLLRRRCRSLRE